MTTLDTARATPRTPRHINPRVVVGVVYVGAMLLATLDITVVNVALPAISRDFGVSPASAGWVVVGYVVSLAAVIPASGWFGDRFGTKRVFLTAVALFVAASAACGLAPNLAMLVVFRVLKGIGGGMVQPVGMAMMWRTFPPEERARAARILIIPTLLGPAGGPLLGGVLVDHLSWRWAFFVNVPVGAAICLFGYLFLHEHREERAGGFDAAGFVLAGPGLAALLYALGEGPRAGWGSARVIGPALAGAIALALLVKVELSRREPMLDLRLYRERLFRTINIVSLFGFGAFLGFLFLIPIFVQDVRGGTALDSGLITLPEALGVLFGTQVLVSRLYPRVGPRRLIMVGYTGVALFASSFALFDLDTSTWVLRVMLFGLGSCVSFCFMSIQTSVFARIEPAAMGRASALYNAQRQSATAIGVAVLATVLKAALPTAEAGTGLTGQQQLGAFHVAFLAAASMALVGAVAAYFIHDEDAASTMVLRR